MPRSRSRERTRDRDRDRDRDRRRSRSPDAEKEERRRRRAKMWDVDPSGNVAPPGAAAAAGANPMAAMQQTAMLTAVLQQQAALTRRARRLHVGNLPPGLNTDAIKELFNTTMTAAKLTLDENPCVCDVHMSGDARFSFVEFRSVLECSNALVLDGMQLLGKALKVQRPNDYQAPPPGLDRVIIPQSISAVVTSSTVPNATAGILGMHGASIAALGGNPAMAAALSAAGVGPTHSASGLSGAALAAMSMGQNSFAGAGALAGAGAATALGQNHMGLTRRCRRIHVGNLPLGVGLTAEMLKQFFNAALVSANLHDTSKEGDPVTDSMLGTEGKFGFIEFRTIAEATSCIALNNIELGGKQLRIERPRDYAPMPEAMLDELRKQGILGNTSISPDGKDILGSSAAPPPPSAPLTLSASTGLLGLTGLPIAIPAQAAPPPIDAAAATPVLVLKHMISEKDAGDEAEMGDILEDAKSECSKHGTCSLLSPKPGASGPPGSKVEAKAIALKVFVQFSTAAAALACGKELHGKQFDGRTVQASFVPVADFEELRGLPCYAA